MKKKRKQWTQQEKVLLKKIYSTASWDEMINIFQTSKDNITHKAKQLGIKREMVNFAKYTPEEIKFIRDNYGKLPIKFIAEKLGRTSCAIETKIKKMKLTTRTYWENDEIELLRDLYPKYSNIELSEMFFENRTPEAIATMAHKLNLVKNNIPEQKQKHFSEEELLRQIKEIYKKLGRTPLFSELRLYGLPSERTITRYCGGYKHICKKMGMPENKSLFGKTSYIGYSLNNDICYSRGELIITDFFIQNNIKYRKEELLYKEIFNISEFGTKRMDWLLNDNTVVEFFGLTGFKDYDEGVEEKIFLCEKYEVKLIPIYSKDLISLKTIFKDYIK